MAEKSAGTGTPMPAQLLFLANLLQRQIELLQSNVNCRPSTLPTTTISVQQLQQHDTSPSVRDFVNERGRKRVCVFVCVWMGGGGREIATCMFSTWGVR